MAALRWMRRGDSVVGALLHIDVVVGMDRVFAAQLARGQFVGPAGDHLVGIHVGRGPRTGLKNIQHELGVELSLDDLLGCLLNQVFAFLVEQAQLVVDLGQAHLINPMAAMKRRGKRKLEMGKFSTARAVCAP